jgi:endoglucanase
MVAYRLMPDVCIVLDVTHATDTPGIEHAVHGEVTLGGGPSVTHGTCNHPKVVKRLLKIADKREDPDSSTRAAAATAVRIRIRFTT